MIARSGMKLFYELQDGEEWRILQGRFIIAHPDRPPKVIYPDGTIEELRASGHSADRGDKHPAEE